MILKFHKDIQTLSSQKRMACVPTGYSAKPRKFEFSGNLENFGN